MLSPNFALTVEVFLREVLVSFSCGHFESIGNLVWLLYDVTFLNCLSLWDVTQLQNNFIFQNSLFLFPSSSLLFHSRTVLSVCCLVRLKKSVLCFKHRWQPIKALSRELKPKKVRRTSMCTVTHNGMMEPELGEGPLWQCRALHGGWEPKQWEQMILVGSGGPEWGTERWAESERHPHGC